MPTRSELNSARLKRLSELLAEAGHARDAKWLESFMGSWLHLTECIREANQENAALRKRIAVLSNAGEAVFTHFSFGLGVDPDTEVVLGLLYTALNPGEKAEGSEVLDDYLLGYDPDHPDEEDAP